MEICYRSLREGRLPGFRVGKHWRVRHSDLVALIHPSPSVALAEKDDAPC
jgi:hypothetical protein